MQAYEMETSVNRVMGTMTRGSVALRWAGWAAILLFVAGCPDPEAQMDQFLDNTKSLRDVTQAEVGGGSLADVSGDFLFAISTVIAPDLPLQFLATTKFVANENGDGGVLDIDLHPLSLSTGSTTEPRQLVGDVIPLKNLQVDADGRFDADLGTLTVVGAANPISGSDILAKLTLSGVIQSADLYCGSVAGEVMSPIQAPIDGSSFGAVRVTGIDALPTTITAKCPDGGGDDDAGPTDDTIESDAGSTEDVGADAVEEDMGPPKPTCPAVDLAGTYDLQFKTDAQTSASDVRMVLTASEDDNCYTGVIESKSDNSKLADVTSAVLVEGALVIKLVDFVIPPGQTAVLPNGGKADVTLNASSFSETSACGAITFDLKEPFSLQSKGTFATAKTDSGITVGGPTCDDLGGGADNCPQADLAGEWSLQFKTAAQTSASDVWMKLAAGTPDTCFSGTIESKSTGDKLADVTSALLVDGKLVISIVDFLIPPGQSALLPNGGKADVVLTADQYDDTSSCGAIQFNLKEPFQTSSAGTFATAKTGSGITVEGPTCDQLTTP